MRSFNHPMELMVSTPHGERSRSERQQPQPGPIQSQDDDEGMMMMMMMHSTPIQSKQQTPQHPPPPPGHGQAHGYHAHGNGHERKYGQCGNNSGNDNGNGTSTCLPPRLSNRINSNANFYARRSSTSTSTSTSASSSASPIIDVDGVVPLHAHMDTHAEEDSFVTPPIRNRIVGSNRRRRRDVSSIMSRHATSQGANTSTNTNANTGMHMNTNMNTNTNMNMMHDNETSSSASASASASAESNIDNEGENEDDYYDFYQNSDADLMDQFVPPPPPPLDRIRMTSVYGSVPGGCCCGSDHGNGNENENGFGFEIDNENSDGNGSDGSCGAATAAAACLYGFPSLYQQCSENGHGYGREHDTSDGTRTDGSECESESEIVAPQNHPISSPRKKQNTRISAATASTYTSTSKPKSKPKSKSRLPSLSMPLQPPSYSAYIHTQPMDFVKASNPMDEELAFQSLTRSLEERPRNHARIGYRFSQEHNVYDSDDVGSLTDDADVDADADASVARQGEHNNGHANVRDHESSTSNADADADANVNANADAYSYESSSEEESMEFFLSLPPHPNLNPNPGNDHDQGQGQNQHQTPEQGRRGYHLAPTAARVPIPFPMPLPTLHHHHHHHHHQCHSNDSQNPSASASQSLYQRVPARLSVGHSGSAFLKFRPFTGAGLEESDAYDYDDVDYVDNDNDNDEHEYQNGRDHQRNDHECSNDLDIGIDIDTDSVSPESLAPLPETISASDKATKDEFISDISDDSDPPPPPQRLHQHQHQHQRLKSRYFIPIRPRPRPCSFEDQDEFDCTSRNDDHRQRCMYGSTALDDLQYTSSDGDCDCDCDEDIFINDDTMNGHKEGQGQIACPQDNIMHSMFLRPPTPMEGCHIHGNGDANVDEIDNEGDEELQGIFSRMSDFTDSAALGAADSNIYTDNHSQHYPYGDIQRRTDESTILENEEFEAVDKKEKCSSMWLSNRPTSLDTSPTTINLHKRQHRSTPTPTVPPTISEANSCTHPVDQHQDHIQGGGLEGRCYYTSSQFQDKRPRIRIVSMDQHDYTSMGTIRAADTIIKGPSLSSTSISALPPANENATPKSTIFHADVGVSKLALGGMPAFMPTSSVPILHAPTPIRPSAIRVNNGGNLQSIGPVRNSGIRGLMYNYTENTSRVETGGTVGTTTASQVFGGPTNSATVASTEGAVVAFGEDINAESLY